MGRSLSSLQVADRIVASSNGTTQVGSERDLESGIGVEEDRRMVVQLISFSCN